MVAGDTFRAAAVEQLKIWSERVKSEFFSADDPLIQQLWPINQSCQQKIN